MTTLIPEGEWGALSTGMDVTSSGAAIVFCCAEGAIPPPLVLSPSGSFSLQGTYTTPGRPVTEPATYSGTVNGNTMTLNTAAAGGVSRSDVLVYGRSPTALCPCPFIPAP
jgi:hypothetical protein